MDDLIAQHLAAAPPEAPSMRFVDQAAVAANLATLQRAAGDAHIAGVVKADCYGLGLSNVVPTLWHGGVRTFFVAHIDEALALKNLLNMGFTTPGAQPVIYVLNGLPSADAAHTCAANDLRPVLSCAAHIDWWMATPRAPVALHIDTGMTRLGFTGDALDPLLNHPALGQLNVSLVMSHFACADEPGHPLNNAQRAQFDTAVAKLHAVAPQAATRISLGNAPAMLSGGADGYDLVRPGIALYGGRSAPVPAGTLAPVVHVYARIAQVREVPSARTVSYAAAQSVPAGTRLAIVNYGYADGYPRAASSSDATAGGHMAIDGQRVPIVGRITMDLIILDVTALPTPPKPGDWVEVMGRTVTADDIADAAGTIGYEVLTHLGARSKMVVLPQQRAG